MSRVHKVFTSFHHANDQNHKQIFELRFGARFKVIVPGGVQLGDIEPGLKTETIRQRIRDQYLRDTSVTVVLVGLSTWQRKHVDWEISSSLRATQLNPRSGLLGLLLPSYQRVYGTTYDPQTIPPRLLDNVACGYAEIACWTEDPDVVQNLVHAAYLRKGRITPDNSRPLYKNNRSGDRWQ